VIRRAVVFLLTLLFVAAAIASEQKLALEELARAADLIVKARVIDIKSASSGGGNLTTLVTLSVEEVWKGAPPGSQVIVSVRGGSAGGVAQAVSGEARFAPAERTIVFLKASRAHYTVVGGRQGKWAIKSEGDGKEVAQDITGIQRPVDNLRAEVTAATGR
jgi:hypothetical protein